MCRAVGRLGIQMSDATFAVTVADDGLNRAGELQVKVEKALTSTSPRAPTALPRGVTLSGFGRHFRFGLGSLVLYKVSSSARGALSHAARKSLNCR